MANTVHVKKGDTVYILSGKDRGRKGKVLEVMSKESKIVVEGVNMMSKHKKPRKTGEAGGIIKREAPLDSSNALLICPKCNKPVKVGYKIGEDGKKERVCRKCGKVLEVSKDAKETKDTKTVKETKAVKESKEAKEAKEVKEAEEAKKTKKAKTKKEVEAPKATKAAKTAKAAKEVKTAKAAKKEKESK